MAPVDILVEGSLDAVVAQKLLGHLGLTCGTVFGQRGWTYIQQKVSGFASAKSPILILVDFMDTGAACAPEIVGSWLPSAHELCVFRVAVRELESWLMADRNTFAEFAHIALAKVPLQPDGITDPKQTLINLSRHSRSSKIRNGMVPARGTSASEGVSYTPLLTAYCRNHWRPDIAAEASPSLSKALTRLNELHQRLRANSEPQD